MPVVISPMAQARMEAIELTLRNALNDYQCRFNSLPLAFLLGPAEWQDFLTWSESLNLRQTHPYTFLGIPIMEKSTPGVEVRMDKLGAGRVYATYLRDNPPLPGMERIRVLRKDLYTPVMELGRNIPVDYLPLREDMDLIHLPGLQEMAPYE